MLDTFLTWWGLIIQAMWALLLAGLQVGQLMCEVLKVLVSEVVKVLKYEDEPKPPAVVRRSVYRD